MSPNNCINILGTHIRTSYLTIHIGANIEVLYKYNGRNPSALVLNRLRGLNIDVCLLFKKPNRIDFKLLKAVNTWKLLCVSNLNEYVNIKYRKLFIL